MRILRTEAFKEDYKRLPKTAQKKFDEKIKLFINVISHPSLRVTKEFISKTTPPHPCPLPPGERE
jgi:mRNA-degrading endonuclease RelE of RelBE toxin-antitoxin system